MRTISVGVFVKCVARKPPHGSSFGVPLAFYYSKVIYWAPRLSKSRDWLCARLAALRTALEGAIWTEELVYTIAMHGVP